VSTPALHRRMLLALLGALLLAVPWLAQGLGRTRDSAVKAAFLYKFGSFVEWPPGAFASPAATLVIGVYGDDIVASELEQITEGRTIEGHPVHVRRVRGRDDLSTLHILFAGGARESRARELLEAVSGPVLTVADGPVGGDPGPVLFFTEDDGLVRFAASLPAAAAHGLKLSAKLLGVAQQVEGR
jgi:hypothetical protein